ncbi:MULTISPECIES: bacteriocin immunity protein [unclassified Pseudomonas]|uniref:bacteriocin immunity protein n=1 Tax=unclassified Pseudomonas TaxID=196821 RepID=UPI001B32499B|nr:MULTISPECIES: bacteriocin immunity protein [unclassified Pseudomonas]MBP5947601.1 bacteriocin immunity protein [Pseudomonas sp. P9(2020)]MBZ9565928.1 bacteriocin immunity protein [Pseudomonas sp. P116]
MGLKSNLADHTEQEFKALIQAIEDAKTEDERDELVDHFNKIVPHPAGSDLLFYPEAGEDDSAAGVTSTVSDYCLANGLPGFKI